MEDEELTELKSLAFRFFYDSVLSANVLPRGFSVFNNALIQRVPPYLRCLNLNPLSLLNCEEIVVNLLCIYLRAIFLNNYMKKTPFTKVTISSQTQQNYE
jgi:hypothetical protein